MKIKRILIGLASLTLLASCGGTTAQSKIDESLLLEKPDRDFYDNSVDFNDLESAWDEYGLGDPFVYRFNGMYYLYVSTKNFEVGVKAWKSEDLVHWEPCNQSGIGDAFVTLDECTLGAYAPEVTYYNGTFYMCQSQSGNGHYILTSSSPEGPFVKASDNIGESIDGSFFIDDDEQIYFLRASTTGIRMIQFNSNMTKGNSSKQLDAANIGGWTEGPYMLKKDGNYYVTFTGTSVISDSYRVGYAYHEKNMEEPMFSRDGFKFGNNILLNTDESFRGLGHSSTVMGPNMDSYYIVYHNLRSVVGPDRALSINRLMFNGSEMSVPYYGLNNNIAPQMPEFSVTNGEGLTSEGSFVLSDTKSDDLFTAEFNFIGSNVKGVFSYVDASNYNYVTVTDQNVVKVISVKNNEETTIGQYVLVNPYDYTKLHTLRVSYSDGILDVYFDTMNVISKISASFVGGKIGYVANSVDKENIYYTAYSNAAHDSSQQDDFKQDNILCNTFDRKLSTVTEKDLVEATHRTEDGNALLGSNYISLKGKVATYKIYVPEDGYYGIDMRLPTLFQNKKVAVAVDNQQYQILTSTKIDSEDDEYVTTVGGIAIKAGVHYLSFTNVGNDEFQFRDVSLFKSSTAKETFTSPLNDYVYKGANYVNIWKIKNNGHYALAGNKQLMYFGTEGMHNYSVEVAITLDGETQASTCGVVLRASNPSFSASDDSNSIQAFYVGFNNNKIFINECNYNLSTDGGSDAVRFESGKKYVLKAECIDNTINCYIDGKLMLSYVSTLGVTHGYAGFYTDGASAIYQDLKIEIL